MKFRVISLLLTIALALAMFLPSAPAKAASADNNEAARLEKQIRQVYAAAQRSSGRYTFNGWCGTLVSWELYLMGIDSRVHGADGKDQYDLYAARDITCGGYGVKRYPASKYTLKQALNTITRDGTVDAYNILVGFQRTHTAAGKIYGHAVVIHGIVDGTVYFMESYSTSLGGQYWAEGAPISCSIDAFCDYYSHWTVFDGVIHFGVKTYAQLCTAYGANMTVVVKSDIDALTEPVDEGINEAHGTVERLMKGQQVEVSGLYETPEGGFWYQLELKSGIGFVPVEAVMTLQEKNANVSVYHPQIPASSRKGAGMVLRGNVSSLNGDLTRVQVLVYGEAEEPLIQAKMELSGKVASLSDYRLDRHLNFRDLDVGTYRVVVLADVSDVQIKDGEAITREQSVKVWESQLQIVTDWRYYYKVSFDGNGGEVEQNQWTLDAEKGFAALPEATRMGYKFNGWALDPEGKQPVAPEDVPKKNVTLYARWEKAYDREADILNVLNGTWKECTDGFWYEAEGIRFLRYNDGSWPEGWHVVDGSRFYFNVSGAVYTGWQVLDSKTYYFSADGTCVSGWQEIDGNTYCFGVDGDMQTGWLTLEDRQYYLDETGAVVVGWVSVNGMECLFGTDGVLQMTLQGTAENGYYVVYDRNAAERMATEEAKLLLG